MDNKNYKIVTFKGGLGNQLFQYSLAIYLKQELNQKVKLDLSWFKTQDKRKFLLNDYLKVEFDIIDENSTNLFDRIISYRSEKIISKFLKKKKIRFINNFNGYWQDIFFASHLSLSHFDQSLFKKEFNETEYYIIHYRSGDFKQSKAHNILSLNYYTKAINFFKDKKIFLLTADIEDLDKNFLEENNIEYLNLNEKDAFKIIFFAKGGIASNSTFSWWPIYLSKCKNWVLPYNLLKKKDIISANLHIPGTLLI